MRRSLRWQQQQAFNWSRYHCQAHQEHPQPLLLLLPPRHLLQLLVAVLLVQQQQRRQWRSQSRLSLEMIR
jgi:hypothetical protein